MYIFFNSGVTHPPSKNAKWDSLLRFCNSIFFWGGDILLPIQKYLTRSTFQTFNQYHCPLLWSKAALIHTYGRLDVLHDLLVLKGEVGQIGGLGAV